MKRLSLLLWGFLLLSPLWSLSPPLKLFWVTSGVGYRLNPMGGGNERLHRGADLVGPANCEVLASESGTVVENWPAPGTPNSKGGIFSGHPTFGGYTVIDHGNGLFTCYGHMSLVLVRTGQKVSRGQTIGYQGSTGQCTGAHLHFEVIQDPTYLFLQRIEDPRELLR